MTSDLSAALRAAADGLDPDEAAAGLIISYGAFLHRDDFTRYIRTTASISDGTPMAWVDWDAAITAPGSRGISVSSAERRILRIAVSLASGHPVSLRDAIPGLDQRSLHLAVTAIRRAAGQRR